MNILTLVCSKPVSAAHAVRVWAAIVTFLSKFHRIWIDVVLTYSCKCTNVCEMIQHMNIVYCKSLFGYKYLEEVVGCRRCRFQLALSPITVVFQGSMAPRITHWTY